MHLGRHVICDLYGCNQLVLDDQQVIEDILVEAQKIAKANILNVYTRKFSPQGVTVVLQISESHITIHTWPEYEYQQVDIFTCGSSDIESQLLYIIEKLSQKRYTVSLLNRGAIGEQ